MSTQDTSPSYRVFPCVPSDSVNFTAEVRQLYIGGSGDVSVVNQDNSVCTFKNVLAGSTIGPFFLKRVNSSLTTASNIVAFN